MIYDDLKDTYVGELTEAEYSDLVKFASDLLSAHKAGNTETVDGMLKEAAEGLTDYDSFEKVAELCIHCKKNGHKKLAGAVAGALTTAMAGLTSLPYIQEGLRRRRNPKDLKKSINAVYQTRPDFFTPDKHHLTMQYFETLSRFAPDVAKNPMFATNIIDKYHRMGPALMDMNVVKELANTQTAISESRNKGQNALSPRDDLLTGIKGYRQIHGKASPDEK